MSERSFEREAEARAEAQEVEARFRAELERQAETQAQVLHDEFGLADDVVMEFDTTPVLPE